MAFAIQLGTSVPEVNIALIMANLVVLFGLWLMFYSFEFDQEEAV